MVRAVVKCLGEKELPIKVEASKALTEIIRHESAHAMIKEGLAQIL